MNFEQWEAQVPIAIREDSVWKMRAYQLGLFVSDLAWEDAGVLLRDPRSAGFADQLTRAAGKISSNVCEGYSRHTGKGRALFYEYALGSARECRDWYYKSRHVLKTEVVDHRIDLCSQISKLCMTMCDTERCTNRKIVRRH